MNRIKNILIRQPNWVGDNIFTLPAVQELRRRWPEASLTVLTKPGIVPFWKLVPEVDRVIAFPFRGGLHDLRKKFLLARKLGRMRFDLAVIFPRSFESALWAFLAGIRQRWGYREEGRGFLLTRRAVCPQGYRQTHRIDYYFRLLDGGKGGQPAPAAFISLPEKLGAEAQAILKKAFPGRGDHPLIGLHPRASHGPAKCWPVEHYGALAERLGRELGARILIFGTAIEAELNGRVAEAGGASVLDLTGKTSLAELAALMAACDVVVGNDTGPIHLAAATGTSVVALFGSSDPAATAPRGKRVAVIYRNLPCSPCLRQVCPRDTRCLTEITPGEVFSQVKRFLTERKGRPEEKTNP